MMVNDEIINIDVYDLRVPTYKTLLGSDPFHTKPNYSAVYIKITTKNKLEGNSIVFTLGAGNDWILYCIKDLSKLLIKMSLLGCEVEFISSLSIRLFFSNPVVIRTFFLSDKILIKLLNSS